MGWCDAPQPRFVDDGGCQRTKTSWCPRTLRPFVNRCTKDFGHKSGCRYNTTAAIAEAALTQRRLPGFLPAIEPGGRKR